MIAGAEEDDGLARGARRERLEHSTEELLRRWAISASSISAIAFALAITRSIRSHWLLRAMISAARRTISGSGLWIAENPARAAT